MGKDHSPSGVKIMDIKKITTPFGTIGKLMSEGSWSVNKELDKTVFNKSSGMKIFVYDDFFTEHLGFKPPVRTELYDGSFNFHAREDWRVWIYEPIAEDKRKEPVIFKHRYLF